MYSNPFDGKGEHAKFAWALYKRLKSRDWFSLADVMVDRFGLKSPVELPCSVSKCDNYGELKKASMHVLDLIRKKVGYECIQTDGNNRGQRIRYTGAEDDPLVDLCNSSAIKDIKTYTQFCIDSAGFFPKEWLEYFFEDTLDLLDITRRRKNGEQYISSSIDRELTNINLLPQLYEAIRDKTVLAIEYKPTDKPQETLIFHPHILKEHNGRWFLFGHAEEKLPESGYNVALDRIVDAKKADVSASKYLAPSKGFYENFFKDIVGVSHQKGYSATDVIVRSHSQYIHRLTETKKIHRSQKTVKPFGQYEDGVYGEFQLFVEPNNEFMGRILQMGDGLEIISPTNIREMVWSKVEKMTELYRQ